MSRTAFEPKAAMYLSLILLVVHGSIVAGAAPLDWDGNGKSDPTVFREDFPHAGATSFLVIPSSGRDLRSVSSLAGWIEWGPGFYKAHGLVGDYPVPEDYSGDGKCDSAVVRPSTMMWYISYAFGGGDAVQWGLSGDVPIPRNYGFYIQFDGKHDICVYRPWEDRVYLRYSTGRTRWVSWKPTRIPGYNVYRFPLQDSGIGRLAFIYGGSDGRALAVDSNENNTRPRTGDYRFVRGSDYVVSGNFVSSFLGAWWRPSTGA